MKVSIIHNPESHSGLDCRPQLCLNFNHRPGNTWRQKLQLSHEYSSRVSASDSLGCEPAVYLNIDVMLAKAVALPQIREAVLHILTWVLNIAKNILITNWHWQICSDRAVITICAKDCLVHLHMDHMPAKPQLW